MASEVGRRDFLKGAGLALAGVAGCRQLDFLGLGPGAPDPSTMNILFIDNEDLTAEAIGCYGNPIVKTPHLDKLAATGVRFARAYCQAPICNPSRSSLGTALRPETTGVFSNNENMETMLPKNAVSIAELLKRKGAFLANIGKLYHHHHTAVQQYSAFDRLEFGRPKGYQGISRGYRVPPGTPPNPGTFRYSPDPAIEAKLRRLKRERDRLAKVLDRSDPRYWNKVQGPFYRVWTELLGDSGRIEERDPDGRKARLAAQMLRQFSKDGRRFFLSLGFSKPHTPLRAPKKYIDLYDPDKIPMPQAPPDQDRGIPDCAKRYGKNYDLFNTVKQTPERVRRAIAAYYACTTFIVAQVGLVLDALEKTGLADNTLVIFFGDHGFNLGEHGCWSKYSLFEQSTRVPLIVRLPGAAGNGRPCDEIVELIDLLPTMADVWDIPAPASFEGTSFRPLLADPARPWKKAAFTTVDIAGWRARSVRTKRHRYTEWTKGAAKETELYDLGADPWEQVNLAGDRAHAATTAELAALLKQGWRAARPPTGT